MIFDIYGVIVNTFSMFCEGYNITRFPRPSGVLSDDDKHALRLYGSQYYSTPMNNALWSAKLMANQHGYNRLTPHEKLHNKVIEVLDKFPAAREDNFVYTGLSKHAAPESWSNHGLVYIPAFISTSYDKEIPRNFADVHHSKEVEHLFPGYTKPQIISSGGYMNGLKIHVPANLHVGGSISRFTGMRDEKEFLIKPHQILKITGIRTIIKPRWEHSPEMRYYHARILSPNEIDEYKDHPEVKRMQTIKRRLGIKY